MLLDKIPAQPSVDSINVIIEIPANSDPIKYEFDKEYGVVVVDRFNQTSMSYPCNYGFVPNTLSGDGDPIDVLVITHYPLMPSCMIKVRPIGVLMMEDESGVDEKIIAVPVDKVDRSFADIQLVDDLCPMLKQRITHFFEHYKDLDPGKWVKIIGFEDKNKAHEMISQAIDRYIDKN